MHLSYNTLLVNISLLHWNIVNSDVGVVGHAAVAIRCYGNGDVIERGRGPPEL